MAKFLSRKFRRFERHYHFEIGIDQLAALRQNLSITITAHSSNIDGSGGVSIEAELRIDPENLLITVSIEGEDVGQISLIPDRQIPSEAESEMERDADEWQWIKESLGRGASHGAEDAIGAIIDSIPAIDPMFGCLLRGAISATVVQIIICHRTTRERGRGTELLRLLARCLGRNVLSLLDNGVRKSLLCMVRGGV